MVVRPSPGATLPTFLARDQLTHAPATNGPGYTVDGAIYETVGAATEIALSGTAGGTAREAARGDETDDTADDDEQDIAVGNEAGDMAATREAAQWVAKPGNEKRPAWHEACGAFFAGWNGCVATHPGSSKRRAPSQRTGGWKNL